MARLRAPARRRQLLEIAAVVFARDGYRGATTAELAKAAGITEPILYRHFDSKLDLFVTLIEEVGDEVLGAWRAALSQASSPRERLRVLLASNPATHERGRGIYRVLFHAMTESQEDARIRSAIRSHVKRLHAFIQDEIRSLQQQKTIRRDVDAERLAWLLVDVAIGFGMVSPIIAREALTESKARTQSLIEAVLTG